MLLCRKETKTVMLWHSVSMIMMTMMIMMKTNLCGIVVGLGDGGGQCTGDRLWLGGIRLCGCLGNSLSSGTARGQSLGKGLGVGTVGAVQVGDEVIAIIIIVTLDGHWSQNRGKLLGGVARAGGYKRQTGVQSGWFS